MLGVSIALNINEIVIGSESIVLTFIGILATFVVMSNYAQVKDVERKNEEQVKELERKNDATKVELKKYIEEKTKEAKNIAVAISLYEQANAIYTTKIKVGIAAFYYVKSILYLRDVPPRNCKLKIETIVDLLCSIQDDINVKELGIVIGKEQYAGCLGVLEMISDSDKKEKVEKLLDRLFPKYSQNNRIKIASK